MKFEKAKIGLKDVKTGKPFTVDGWRMELKLYNSWIEVVIGQSKEINRFHDSGSMGGFVHSSNNTHLMWLSNRGVSHLVHELYHLVNRISKAAGLSDDTENEQQAYLTGWLYDEIRKLK